MNRVVILDAQRVSQLAYHESGHAVTAWRLGVPITSATLTLVITQGHGCSRRDRALVAFGGPCAEDSYGGYDAPTRERLWATNWSVDLTNALTHLAGADIVPVLRQARRLVDENWSLVEVLAQALTSQGRLTGAEVAAVIGSED